ncbi:hypothetical protein DFJ74DRAFT_434872 [Hyaloraphidium curvatum]|nr:hypothetical protein DFJ74DRAFT_434872 [Hyaloraphidium curvatum]
MAPSFAQRAVVAFALVAALFMLLGAGRPGGESGALREGDAVRADRHPASRTVPPPPAPPPAPPPSQQEAAPSQRGPPPAKRTSFRYVHAPKVGSSFVIVLRNYLDACPVKRFSCPGVFGGGFWAHASPTGKDLPFSFPASEEDMRRTADCGGKLLACQDPPRNTLHKPWGWRGTEEKADVVAMLRDPKARLLSHWAWEHASEVPDRSTTGRVKAFDAFARGCLRDRRSHPRCGHWMDEGGWAAATTKTLAGFRFDSAHPLTPGEFSLAKRRLFGEAAFFGITERWNETVCTFHCELGGEADPSELVNTRDNGRFSPADAAALSEEVKEHFGRVLAQEEELYAEAVRRFEERARRCRCWTASDGASHGG